MIVNPYADCRGRWRKAALHVHTTRSDGKEDIETTINHYRELGYGVIAVTDHDIPGEASCVRDGLVLLSAMERTTGPHHTGEIGDLVIANHPTWHFDHWLVSDLLQHPEFHAIEVYNAAVDGMPGDGKCTTLWDKLLSAGRRLNGVATDDAHTREHRDHAWVCVDAEANVDDVQAALLAGRYYASSGVGLREIRLTENVLTVHADEPCEFRFIVERGQVRQRSRGTSASYQICDGDGYVRVEALGGEGRCAWTNPLWPDDELSHKRLANHETWLLRRCAEKKAS